MRATDSSCRDAAWIVLLMLGACSDDSDEPGAGGASGASGASGNVGDPVEVAELGAQLEGIYEVTVHQMNLNACGVGGSSVAGHGFFLVMSTSLPTLTAVQVFSCASLEECRVFEATAEANGFIQANFIFRFYERTGEASLAGTVVIPTFTAPGSDQCFRRLVSATLVETAPGELHIEARAWRGDIYGANSFGSCHTDTGDVPTMDDPCELEAVTGTFVETLP